MTAAICEGIFYAIAALTHQEHWQLTKKESVDLGKATWDMVRSLDKKKQNKWLEKFLKDYAPQIKFMMVLGGISIGRLAYSAELIKLKNENERLRNNPGINSDPAASGAASDDILNDGFVQ
jgi:hypothetical protein